MMGQLDSAQASFLLDIDQSKCGHLRQSRCFEQRAKSLPVVAQPSHSDVAGGNVHREHHCRMNRPLRGQPEIIRIITALQI